MLKSEIRRNIPLLGVRRIPWVCQRLGGQRFLAQCQCSQWRPWNQRLQQSNEMTISQWNKTWQWHHFITMMRLHYNPIITPSQWNDWILTIRKLKYHNALSAHSYKMSTKTTLSITSLNPTKSKNTTLLELWKIELNNCMYMINSIAFWSYLIFLRVRSCCLSFWDLIPPLNGITLPFGVTPETVSPTGIHSLLVMSKKALPWNRLSGSLYTVMSRLSSAVPRCVSLRAWLSAADKTKLCFSSPRTCHPSAQ